MRAESRQKPRNFVSREALETAYVVCMTTKRVYRYEMRVDDSTTVDLPVGAEILKFAARDQHPDVIEFWALVNPEARVAAHLFRVAGTGHDIKEADTWVYVDSVITARGALVWHVFRMETMEEWAERTGQ